MTNIEHPLETWLKANGVSYADASSRCKRGMRATSPKYIEQIAKGWQRPGTDIALFISEELTDGAVSIAALMTFTYRRPRNPKSKTRRKLKPKKGVA